MKQKELKKIASSIWDLEKECQKGNNVLENMNNMTKLVENLSLEDIMKLAEVMEASTCKNKNFLV